MESREAKLTARAAQQIRGTDVVGSASLAFTVASLGPFLLIIFLGITQLDIVEVVQVRRPQSLATTRPRTKWAPALQ